MNRRNGVLAAVAALAVPLVIVAAAYACGSLATLKLNRATATAGAEVKATGGNYNTSPRASTIQLRFNSRNGRILWEGRPAPSGRFTATFAAPAARAGYYVVVATQTGPDGRPAAGTPGRAPLRMRRGSSSKSSGAAAVAPFAAPSSGEGPPSQGAPVGLIGIGALALGLAGGAVLMRLGRQRRRRLDVARPIA